MINRNECLKLKFSTEVPFTSYNFTAFIGGAIFSGKTKWAMPYYLNKHILLASNNVFDVICDDMVMFSDREILLTKPLPRSIRTETDIKEIIIEMLNKGYYLSATVNEFYIPTRTFYGVKDFYHDILIYGYDIQKKVFNTAGYDESGYFKIMECDMDIALKSMAECLVVKKERPFFHFFKPKYKETHFDLFIVKNSLNHYLSATPLERRSYDGYYGIGAYENLIRLFSEAYKENKYWREASFSMLLEHKIMMKNRIEYIQGLGVDLPPFLLEEASNIVARAKVIELQYLKLKLTRKEDTYLGIIDKIEFLAEKEEKMLSCLLQQI